GYRMQGGRACEITKLAMAPSADTRKTLAALFHAVFMYAHIQHRCTDMFIEVNPRHRRYYEAMLGFQCLGEPRHNQRVNAPGYLMWSSMDHIAQQIATLGGTASPTSAARSLYPHFLAPADAASLASHLLNKAR
ncbi:MAG: N-acetyltransferase, partial [Burkholderiaceae bacterium]|nr:N-acetyltransferase [Burkholderiaceae bacterium]